MLGLMETWSGIMQERPENLNAFVATKIDKIKRAMAPSYFDHEMSDLPNGPYLWFDDVTLAFKNILAGNDMQETRSLFTGMSTSVEDVTSFGTLATSIILVIRNINVPQLWPNKYLVFENAMQNLNSTSCLNLAICHQNQMKVRIDNLTDKNGPGFFVMI